MDDFWSEVLLRMPVTVPIALISGIFSALAGIVAARSFESWLLARDRKRLIAAKEAYVKKHGEFEVAMVLSVGSDIEQAALDHLRKQDRSDIHLHKVHQDKPLSDDEANWSAYLERIKGVIRKIRADGASRVYLFTQLPVAMAVFAGATLTNGPEVVLHHWHSGHYEPIGRLTVETVRF